MYEPYLESAVLVYTSYTATTLEGSIITFFELSEKPLIFSSISKNKFYVYMINPAYSVESFVQELPTIVADLHEPIYLFKHDKICLDKYELEYKTNFSEIFSNVEIFLIENKRFSYLEDFYSFTLPECYDSYLTYAMYNEFAKTKELYSIINFVRSIIFSKLVLVIDSCSTYNFVHMTEKNIIVASRGETQCSLPDKCCLIDFQTTGLEESSDIFLFTIYKNNSFFSYYLNDISEMGQFNFREFIKHTLSYFEIVYVLNYSFESKFFPELKSFVDIRFKKYQYWVSARKLVHLPFFHKEFDPGSGKNVPIWNKLFVNGHDLNWKNLIIQRAITNVFTKLAILASNEMKIPFNDSIVADTRRLVPSQEFLLNFFSKSYLLKKKICYYPTELFDKYNFANGKYSTMYENNFLSFTQESEEEK